MLVPIADGVWQLPAAPLKLPGGVRMPLASTIVRLPDRSLLVYSPAKMDDAMGAAVDAQGEVAHIVAPSLFHHLYAGDAAARWPKATVHGGPGLAMKRADVKFHRDLGGELDAALRDVFECEVVGGAPRINEAVMLHRPTGTLLCADFLFNVTKPANLRTRMVLLLTGSGGRELRQSRVWRLARKDKAAMRASVERILTWQIAHVAPVHGESIAIDTQTLAPKLARSYGGKPPALLATGAAS